ncbi:MAG: zinc-ribbon domain-containing protein [Desulfovibrionales bacterium]
MLFIFWTGQKIERKRIGSGTFYCPSCTVEKPYALFRLKKRTTLYSVIPLGRGEDMGEVVQCEHCRTDFPAQVLQRTSLIDSGSVWICPSCRNVNPEGDPRCLRCGATDKPK